MESALIDLPASLGQRADGFFSIDMSMALNSLRY